jgi:hypothetical protein
LTSWRRTLRSRTILGPRIPTTRTSSLIPTTIRNLSNLKNRLWSQNLTQNPTRTTNLMIRMYWTTNLNLRSLTRNSNRMILTKSLNWRSRQKHSSRSGRRRSIAIRSLKVPPRRLVSIEPSKVAVQSASFVGRFVSC